jgi:DNA mismatch endonuclease (patch repair protein)
MGSAYRPWASSAATRAVMQANRRRDTRPEMAVRRAVHAMGLRYRVDARPLRGLNRRADLVFSSARVAVFVDGCYWHGCAEHGTTARTNPMYWQTKIAGNVQRDRETDDLLAMSGWVTVRVWEHEDPRDAAARIARVVRARNQADPRRRIAHSAQRRAYDPTMTSDLHQFTALTWIVGPLVDQGHAEPMDVIVAKIEDGTLFQYLTQKYGDEADVTLLTPERQTSVLEKFRELTSINARRKFGIERNGLVLLLGYASEALQQGLSRG